MYNSLKHWLFYSGILTIACFQLNAQPLETVKRIEIEADPIAFIFSL